MSNLMQHSSAQQGAGCASQICIPLLCTCRLMSAHLLMMSYLPQAQRLPMSLWPASAGRKRLPRLLACSLHLWLRSVCIAATMLSVF